MPSGECIYYGPSKSRCSSAFPDEMFCVGWICGPAPSTVAHFEWICVIWMSHAPGVIQLSLESRSPLVSYLCGCCAGWCGHSRFIRKVGFHTGLAWFGLSRLSAISSYPVDIRQAQRGGHYCRLLDLVFVALELDARAILPSPFLLRCRPLHCHGCRRNAARIRFVGCTLDLRVVGLRNAKIKT